MELFQTVRKLYQAMGFQSSHRNLTFNWKIFFFICSPTMVGASTGAYFILKATTTIEYAESFFMCVTEFTGITAFLMALWKFDGILSVIDRFNDFIAKRKL